jgi:hypothetical protein
LYLLAADGVLANSKRQRGYLGSMAHPLLVDEDANKGKIYANSIVVEIFVFLLVE